MAHQRRRYIEKVLKTALRHRGIVGVFGHRQVGKTTVLEGMSGGYVTMDRSTTLQQSLDAPEDFLKSRLGKLPLAIDECQLSPPLFPALKEWVRVDKRPGLFLLSGSVRFSSRAAIKESLTGRMLAYELLPFSISEQEGLPLNDFIPRLLQCKGFSGFKIPHFDAPKTGAKLARYLDTGGLPGVCFVRNDRDRHELIESQLDLILDRDLRLVCETTLPLSSLKNLARLLAQLQNTPLNLSEVSRKSRISPPTLRKILAGFEAIFLVRILPCEGNEARPVLFFEDQGEATYLSSLRLAGQPPASGSFVTDLERLTFAHVRVPLTYATGVSFQISQYRQQGGAYVPFVLRAGKNALGLVCMEESHPSLAATRSAASFLSGNAGAKVAFLHPGKTAETLDDRRIVLPIHSIL